MGFFDNSKKRGDVSHLSLFKKVLKQLKYFYIQTYGTAKVDMNDGQIADKVAEIFDMRPYSIERRLKLRNPIYSDSAAYGHMGRTPEKKEVSLTDGSGNTITKEVETFTWEKLDYVDEVKKAFGL